MKTFKRSWPISITVLFVLTILLMTWTVSAGAVSKKDLRRVSKEGPVEVTVLFLNPLQGEAGDDLSFEVRMSTHSVNLDAYKMDALSVLQVDDGKETEPLGWFEPGGGGHHISGVLKFKGPVPDNAGTVKLIIRGIGSVPERVFEWSLPLE